MEKNEKKRRRLSPREVGLLIVFVLLLVGAGWYSLLWQPMQLRQGNAVSRQESAKLLIEQEEVRAARKAKMVKALDGIAADPSAAPLPVSDYDNYLNILIELRRQLGTRSYESIDGLVAGDPDEAGIYRRSVTVSNVVCENYDEARALVDSVAAGPYRCMLKSVSFAAMEGEDKTADAAVLVPGTGVTSIAPAEGTEEPAATEVGVPEWPEEWPAAPVVTYYTLLTFTVTYYEQELDD